METRIGNLCECGDTSEVLLPGSCRWACASCGTLVAGDYEVRTPPEDEEVPVTFYVLRERGGERRYLSHRTGACLARSSLDAVAFPRLDLARDVQAQLPDLVIRRIVLRSEAV